ncbi:hypothetical protein HPB49_006579 [Dermacentor silvarum]|uniref:Uncharacterized protein n=1 Tax=Dermacentor silvarum TaxID=543639 RepID=A0ACB8DBU8_DERSI|nr:hypothetical protein HPB49_006579 [Dermacentor silvarum]
MGTLQTILSMILLSAASAAMLDSVVKEHTLQKTEQDEKLQTSLNLLFGAVDRWLDGNDVSGTAVLQQRLDSLVDEAVRKNIALAANKEENDGEHDDEVSEYGLGKKLKKWRKKIEKVLGMPPKLL